MFRSFRHRDYRLFYGGQLVSLVGTWLQSVALSWLVYRLTGSGLKLGLVGLAGQLPLFLAAPAGGLLADRVDRRSTLIATQTASLVLALILGALTVSGHIRLWAIYALSAALGLVNAFDIPVRQAFVVQLVGRKDLGNAIALNSSAFNGARLLGPAVAGLLVALVGEGWCFVLNAVSYLPVILALGAIAARPPIRRSGVAHAGRELADGFRYAWREPPIRAVLLLIAVTSLCGAPFQTLMPLFAEGRFHRGATGLGILVSAAGLGALLGALWLAGRRGPTGLGPRIATAAIAFGAALLGFAGAGTFWLTVAAAVPAGVAMMIQMAASNTLLQTLVPDRLRGRVMSVHTMVFMGTWPVGALTAGAVTDRIGPRPGIAAGGMIVLLAGALFALRLPGMRSTSRGWSAITGAGPVRPGPG